MTTNKSTNKNHIFANYQTLSQAKISITVDTSVTMITKLLRKKTLKNLNKL
jgi:hypothetical protein